MDAKSVVPVENGCPNPMYPAVSMIMQNVDLMREQAILVQKMHRQGKSHTEIKQAIREVVLDFYHRFKAVDTEAATMPPPPPANVLYGRFARGAEVLDIGTGNGKKITAFTGCLKITANDLRDMLPRGLCPIIIKPIGEVLPVQSYLSSFMSICQLSPQEQSSVLEHDGMHLVPIHDDLVKLGAATFDGSQYHVRAPLRVYNDNTILKPVTSVVDIGYGILVSYAKRQYTIDFTGTVKKKGSNRAIIDATPIGFGDVNLCDISMKMDGEPWELEVYGGKATITNRNGEYYSVPFQANRDFCIQYEKMSNCLTVIRVIYYGDMMPPHTYNNLVEFASSVHITIDGRNLCAPPTYGGDCCVHDPLTNKTYREADDGVITRIDGHDFYVKYRWTVDLRGDQFDNLERKMNDMGFDIHVTGKTAHLSEYIMQKDGADINFKFIKIRQDKMKATDVDTVIQMLGHATVPEIVALTS